MIDPNVCAQMRQDWNSRAGEDAHYYVAFGRRDQSEDEFFDTAHEIAVSLISELKRLEPGANPRARRALEIGCGPGRLMKPLSAHFGEIHGVDVSDRMIALARERLRNVAHAHPHATSGADLAPFADESFDFVYSYAVFQHIPSGDVVFSYLREARRVLKLGGVLRCQINGLPETAARYDTWSGVRISAARIAAFAAENDLQLLALEGTETQYMWATFRKRPAGWSGASIAAAPASIRRVTNANSSEPVTPARGRFAAISLWVVGLTPEADLNRMRVRIGGHLAQCTYIGPAEGDGLQQVNAIVPEGIRSGLSEVALEWMGAPMAPPVPLRVIPAPPEVPRVVSISDGINLLAGLRIENGAVKVTLEEAGRCEGFGATVDGRTVTDIDVFCTDPRPPRHEVNFQVPKGLAPGGHTLCITLGNRTLAAVGIEIV